MFPYFVSFYFVIILVKVWALNDWINKYSKRYQIIKKIWLRDLQYIIFKLHIPSWMCEINKYKIWSTIYNIYTIFWLNISITLLIIFIQVYSFLTHIKPMQIKTACIWLLNGSACNTCKFAEISVNLMREEAWISINSISSGHDLNVIFNKLADYRYADIFSLVWSLKKKITKPQQEYKNPQYYVLWITGLSLSTLTELNWG